MELKTVEKASEQLRKKSEASGLQSIGKGLGEQQRTAYYTLPSNGKEHIVQVAIKEFADFFLMNRKTSCRQFALTQLQSQGGQ